MIANWNETVTTTKPFLHSRLQRLSQLKSFICLAGRHFWDINLGLQPDKPNFFKQKGTNAPFPTFTICLRNFDWRFMTEVVLGEILRQQTKT